MKLSKCLTCFYSHLSPEEHLTFTDKPIGIAAKFQYKVLLLRTLTVRNTISLRHGLEVVLIGRVRCTSPQRFWSRKATVDVSMLLLKAQSIRLKTVQRIIIIIIIIIIIVVVVLLLFLIMILIIGLTCPPTIHFKFITKCDTLFLLQSAMVCYYKVRQVLLQSAISVTKRENLITKCDRCYKVLRLLLSATEHLFKGSLQLWSSNLARTKYIYETLHLIGFVWQHWWMKANITFSVSVLCLRKIQSLNFLSYEFTPSLQSVT